jgi:uncharacterized protein YqiB (DUF1249 family)
MNDTERALFDRVYQLSTRHRWPSGRWIRKHERAWMRRFLADWVRDLAGRDA